MKQYYEDYWKRPDTYAEQDPLEETRLRLLWKFAEASNGPLDNRSLLDVGCGEGNIVAAAVERGIRATGMDISRAAIERAQFRHPDCVFHTHSVEELPWPVPASSIDIAVSFEVIEHLMQPKTLLIGAREALKPGGFFGLTTPYHGKLKNIALSLKAFDKHFAVEGDHIRFFSDSSLRRLYEREGFVVEAIEHFGRAPGLWAGVFVWARKA